MRCSGVVVLVLLLVSACGQTRLTVDDDRPPPFRDHGFRTSWTIGDQDQPSDEMVIEDLVEFRVPVLLLPATAGTRVALEIHNVGFDVFVDIAATTVESWLRVASSNQLEAVDCGPAAEPILVRGWEGCFGVEQPGHLLLSWDEEWVHEARWTQDPASPPDHNLDFYLEWLNDWRTLNP